MSLPITIEGAKYFVTLPSFADYRTFKTFLATERRKKSFAAIPTDLADAELKKWMRVINEECEAIDPFKSIPELANSSDGAALLFHALLRHENPGLTLDWTHGLVSRAMEGKPAALAALTELKQSLVSLVQAKKNEAEAAAAVQQPAEPSTSTLSTLV